MSTPDHNSCITKVVQYKAPAFVKTEFYYRKLVFDMKQKGDGDITVRQTSHECYLGRLFNG